MVLAWMGTRATAQGLGVASFRAGKCSTLGRGSALTTKPGSILVVASSALACETSRVRTGLALLAVAWVSLAGCSKPPAAVRCPEPTASGTEVAAATERQTALPSTRVFLVRHAEKANDGTRDPALLPEGVVLSLIHI